MKKATKRWLFSERVIDQVECSTTKMSAETASGFIIVDSSFVSTMTSMFDVG